MRFGVGLPTATAGMMYPTPFATAADVVDIAVEAEQFGYYEVAGNDHITTQQYVRKSYPVPPDFFEPLVTYGYIAARTSVLRLMTGILVMPMRQPVLLAKQLSTLDQLSGGRVMVGAGSGAYREEFVASQPHLAHAHRGRLLNESIEAVRLLFRERRASYVGEYVAFDDVEMFPKPVQDVLPIYPAGNADASIRRAARYGQGWLPAGLGPAAVAAGKKKLAKYAAEEGRGDQDFAIAPQVMVCLSDTTEEAEEIYRRSQLFHHLVTLQQSTLKDVSVDTYVTNNCIGTPDDVIAKVQEFRDAGATHLAGIYFAADNIEQLRAQMRRFATDVMPAFTD
ncbi:LLM class flavin-dependent oxidoreductase [Kribbella sp. NPDC050124]|uniref:LLM class flavin-dependent oxidoreductase n=1 Tax=Kribbella sp. NPDC050124 TaxID=3364114 RepID=UPI00379CF663